jgi:ubiquitin C-terminal hydrolase
MNKLLMDEKNKKLNGLQNPGNFCYLLSAIQALRCMLQEYFEFHIILIEYYIVFSKMLNIFDITDNYFLNLIDIKIKKKELLLDNINKVNKYYNLPEITSIEDIEFVFDKMKDEQLKICCMLLLKQIIDNIEDDNYKNNYIKTINFIKMFNLCTKQNGISYICNGQQNDSNEFIIILLDYLNDCVSKGKKCLLDDKSILEYKDTELNNLDINSRVKIQMQQYYYNTYSKEYSYFHNSLNTLILNIVKCINCGFKQTSINSSNNICCSIPNIDKKNNLSLYSCLDDYFKEEKIEYRCDKCGILDNNIIIKKIIDNKEYLIITIKKFDFNGDLNILTKKHENVTYPLLLNINNYTIKNTENYYLVSVINHIGMLNYGHYFADVLYNNDWFRCNDEIVNNLKVNSILNNNNAYILIYKKK